MTANTWQCIAQTSVFDTGCTIRVAFDGYSISFAVSVKYGVYSINVSDCNIPSSIKFSIRIREFNNQWFVDIYCNDNINPTISIADNIYWSECSLSSNIGVICLTMSDVSNKTDIPDQSGGLDIEQLKEFLLDNGYTDLLGYWEKVDDTLTTPYNITSTKEITAGAKGTPDYGDEGDGSNTPTTIEFTIKIGNDVYTSSNGVITLPAYPSLDNYITNDDLTDKEYANSADLKVLEERIATLESYFTSGSANNATKLGGESPIYYATSSSINEINLILGNLEDGLTRLSSQGDDLDARLQELEALGLTLESEGEDKRIVSVYDFISNGELTAGNN